MTNNNTLKYRMGQVEKKVDGIDDKLDILLTNHIPHIEKSIIISRESMEKKAVASQIRINILTIVNIAALIFAVIFTKVWG